ncbi:hypothetical protein RKD20_000903 [Streptomyces sp. SLBN-8D4]
MRLDGVEESLTKAAHLLGRAPDVGAELRAR